MFRTPQACLEAGEDYPQYEVYRFFGHLMER